MNNDLAHIKSQIASFGKELQISNAKLKSVLHNSLASKSNIETTETNNIKPQNANAIKQLNTASESNDKPALLEIDYKQPQSHENPTQKLCNSPNNEESNDKQKSNDETNDETKSHDKCEYETNIDNKPMTSIEQLNEHVQNISNLQSANNEQLCTLSNLSVPTLRNVETIVTKTQEENKQKINQLSENVSQFISCCNNDKVNANEMMKSLNSVKSIVCEIHNACVKKLNTPSPESSSVNNTNTILNLHGKLTEKHDKIEKVQSDSLQWMDRNMSEISKLNKIINEKDMEICTLKVENAKLMYSQRQEVTNEKNDNVKKFQSEPKQANATKDKESSPPLPPVSSVSDCNNSANSTNIMTSEVKPQTSDVSKAANQGIQYNRKYRSNEGSTAFRGEVKQPTYDDSKATNQGNQYNRNYRSDEGFTAFRGEKRVLSNFYKFKFKPRHELFENTNPTFPSLEHAYAYGKAVFHGDQARAKFVRQSEHPREAQIIGHEIRTNTQWKKTKLLFMELL